MYIELLYCVTNSKLVWTWNKVAVVENAKKVSTVPHLPLHFPIWTGTFIVRSPNKVPLRHKNGVYLHSSKNQKVLFKIQWIFVILLSLFVIGNFGGTCSSVKMLKGFMVRERLVNPALHSAHISSDHQEIFFRISHPSNLTNIRTRTSVRRSNIAFITKVLQRCCQRKWNSKYFSTEETSSA